MQKKTEGICFAISAGICWGSMGVAAQVLMEDSGLCRRRFSRRAPSGCRGAPADVRTLLYVPLASEVFLPTRRSKRHPPLWRARTAHAADVFPGDSVRNAGTAAILAATIPVFTTIWDIFVKHRAPQIREMACTALAIIAVVLITTKGDFDSVSLSLTGVLWGLASSVAGRRQQHPAECRS